MGLLIAMTITIWLVPPIGKRVPVAWPPQANTPVTTLDEQLLSDKELVSLFPKGSCVIAEINGRKELVFFDPQIEANGILVEGMSRR